MLLYGFLLIWILLGVVVSSANIGKIYEAIADEKKDNDDGKFALYVGFSFLGITFICIFIFWPFYLLLKTNSYKEISSWPIWEFSFDDYVIMVLIIFVLIVLSPFFLAGWSLEKIMKKKEKNEK